LKYSTLIQPDTFEPEKHWYPKALNATIHPMVNFFLNLSEERIVKRYCHLHPTVDREKLHELLATPTKYFQWAGADLINVTTAGGKRQMVVIENNSCPSGQKSMPLRDDNLEQGGYRWLVEKTIAPRLKTNRYAKGGIAVLYDKNEMEASGYAAAIADCMKEPVHYVPFYQDDEDPPARWVDGLLEVRDEAGAWHPIRGAFRYLTQRPWTRLPLHSKTKIVNPIVACLAGGRNKSVAAKAYDFYNGELEGTGLSIRTPETIRDVSKAEIPLWVRHFGGQAVVKIPYSNAGQGVFTIVNEHELEAFMAMEFSYERFIVQSLIGNYEWSSTTKSGRLYHVGTIPNAKGETYVCDVRVMLSSTPTGLRPISVYGRRAAKPLADSLLENADSWEMLGTNLSVKQDDGSFVSDSGRLMLMDRRDFNKLGISLDDLIEGYIQTVLSTLAIDRLAQQLYNSQGKFRKKLFKSLNDDQSLIDEIMVSS
jgi:hypothetical protein